MNLKGRTFLKLLDYTPEEIGYLAAFLASDEAAYFTGQEFVIDGGAGLPETNAMGVVND